jgi:hypothetical protein
MLEENSNKSNEDKFEIDINSQEAEIPVNKIKRITEENKKTKKGIYSTLIKLEKKNPFEKLVEDALKICEEPIEKEVYISINLDI